LNKHLYIDDCQFRNENTPMTKIKSARVGCDIHTGDFIGQGTCAEPNMTRHFDAQSKRRWRLGWVKNSGGGLGRFGDEGAWAEEAVQTKALSALVTKLYFESFPTIFVLAARRGL
jgi:hypothetical protein